MTARRLAPECVQPQLDPHLSPFASGAMIPHRTRAGLSFQATPPERGQPRHDPRVQPPAAETETEIACPASVRPAAGRTELNAVSTSQTAAVRRKRSLRTGPSNRWNRPSPTPVGRHLAFGPGHAQPPGWGVSTSEERLPSERHPRMLSPKRLGATGESGEDACLAVGLPRGPAQFRTHR